MIAGLFRFIYTILYLAFCAIIGFIMCGIGIFILNALLKCCGFGGMSNIVSGLAFIAFFGLFMIECLRWIFVKNEKPITYRAKKDRSKHYFYVSRT